MTKYQIEAPVRSFSGESVGVQFTKGTGHVTDADKPGRAALEYFRRHGYGVLAVDDDHKPLDERVNDLVTGPDSPPPPPAGKPDMFDPGEHSVEQVIEHLRKVDESVETRRVLDAEAAGENRAEIASEGAALLDRQEARDKAAASTTTPAAARTAAPKKGARS
ncbi:hypothetical protein [Streptomyces sp. Z26]|uniref:hypothetical protein n=1 Tax=Streptomyces sp. Z26 TaxID=2500177 RepID=UPI000EF16F16|nr:hypothetical protein [Streptomyces sp. Z26]RLL66988.1 hypothetical protein D7M15_09045 [Streptomyces sp. Z26]